MGRVSRKSLTHLFLTAYLAIAVMGAFSFAAVDAFRSVKLEIENSSSTGVFGPLGGRETMVVTEADTINFSLSRIGFQRVTPLPGSPHTGNVVLLSPVTAGVKMSPVSLKSTILLKLRI
ncbi:MAG: hypothetical protein LBT39_05250 [Treponema sp.]|jgi:hypothetical protein|nr:hypothetical protein [Treponema sp.]